MTDPDLPPTLVAAREEAARAYADACRLIYDRLPPGGLDRALLDEEQFRALERFEAAEAELDRLRVKSQLAANARGREPGGEPPAGGGDDAQRPSTRP